jgi:hypothetical protein
MKTLNKLNTQELNELGKHIWDIPTINYNIQHVEFLEDEIIVHMITPNNLVNKKITLKRDK